MNRIDELISRYSVLEICRESIEKSCDLICECVKSGGKILTCGNGGSAADSQHIVGELMKSFVKNRPVDEKILSRIDDENLRGYFRKNLQTGIPAMSLVSESALMTAYMNDCEPELIFAQQLLGIGSAGDVLLGISTSGNSSNVVYAFEIARAKNLKTIALTGKSGGKLKSIADISICVPSEVTFQIQELHLPIYHALCLEIESRFFA